MNRYNYTILAFAYECKQMAMIRKAVWNRYIGPGGGTRHLHQNLFGGEIGLTVYSKDICAVFGRIPPLSVQIK